MAELSVDITAPEIVDMHNEVLLRFGGMAGVRIPGCVESAVNLAQSAEYYSGNEDGTLGLCFIGSLMFYLNKNQCFIDGNKRTSITAALKLLGDLGLTLAASTKELEEYCVEIAMNTGLKSNDVVRWLGKMITPNVD